MSNVRRLPPSMCSFSVSSELSVSPEAFWAGMSMAAVNAELMPLVRMTVPRKWRSCLLEQWASGQVLFRSVILLFGLLPVDVHSLRLERISPGRGFLEQSHSWVNKQWRHERSTVPTNSGCVVTDTVTVHSRVPAVGVLLLPVYRLVFRHRHRRLKGLYGRAVA
jgi:ligand-binding SRPBCC domain-containing protein